MGSFFAFLCAVLCVAANSLVATGATGRLLGVDGNTAAPAATASTKPDYVTSLGLNLAEQAAQTSQLDISALLNADNLYELDESLFEDLVAANKVGSVLNNPGSVGQIAVPTVQEWRQRQQHLYDISSRTGARIPIVYGLDSVHGCNYIFNATLFPQQIGMAATFDTNLVYEAGRITGMESRYAGVPWAFSPILGIAVQPTWARVYETFGEDPFLVSRMGEAIVSGLQSPAPSWMNPPSRASGQANYPGATLLPTNESIPLVAACLKHFAGYPNARTGHDRTPVWLPLNYLLQYFLPPFQAAIDAGALTIMENYVEVNGRPTVSSELLLNFVLRKVLGFEGMLVTDYNEVYNLVDFHHAFPTLLEAAGAAFRDAHIDMAMISGIPPSMPFFADLILNQTLFPGERINATNSIPVSRFKEAANRVLALKDKLGLFAGSPVWPEPSRCAFACPEHRQKGLQAVHESATLLQNNGAVLPLSVDTLNKAGSRVVLIGQACNSIPLMAGGWTINWQGTNNVSAFPYGSTLYEEFHKRLPDASVSFFEGCNVTERSVCGPEALAEALSAAATATAVIVCLGETHYAEKPGDIDDLTLPGEQIMMVEQLSKVVDASVTPFVGVLIEGRPRVLGSIPDLLPAILHGYLPGPSGGEGLADVLLGVVNPSGRLPITYPRTVNNGPQQYYRKYSANWTANWPFDYNVQWSFGHSLHYTDVRYSNVIWEFDPFGFFPVGVNVTNLGNRAVNETVLMFAAATYRTITPEMALLVNFTRVELAPLESKYVWMRLNVKALGYYDEINCQVLEQTMAHLWFQTSRYVSEPSYQFDTIFSYPRLCGLWGTYYQQQTGGTHAVQLSPAAPDKQTSDFVVSSIVCFGAGVVGTIILVQWLVLRRKRKEASLLSSTAGDHAPYEAVDQRHSGDDEAPYRIGAEHISLPSQ